jgi:hypothetical protein
MKKVSIKCLFFAVTLMNISGCVSTSISESLAMIEQQDNIDNGNNVNRDILNKIQKLRALQITAEQNYTFTYQINKDELNSNDKITITKIIVNKNSNIIIQIAPATGNSRIEQLNLSMKRAKILNNYVSNFSDKVTITFAPKLTIDTIKLVTGA